MTTEQKEDLDVSCTPERVGRRWKVNIEVTGANQNAVPPIYVRTLVGMEEAVDDAVAEHLGRRTDASRGATVNMDFVPTEVWDAQEAAAVLSELAQRAAFRVNELHAQAVLILVDQEAMTLRDAGEILNLSPTRVHQLLAMARSKTQPTVKDDLTVFAGPIAERLVEEAERAALSEEHGWMGAPVRR